MPAELRLLISNSWAKQYGLQAEKLKHPAASVAALPSRPAAPLPVSGVELFVDAAAAPARHDDCVRRALNGVLGWLAFTHQAFVAMTKAFDAHAGLPAGTTKAWYAASDNGTLFGYALEWVSGGVYRTQPLSPYLAPNGTAYDQKTLHRLAVAERTAVAAVVYNDHHAWAIKRTQSGWFALDGQLSATPRPFSFAELSVAGVGVEFVYEKTSTPLRIGYISRRFERYPGTQLLLRLFEFHDRSRVHVRSAGRLFGCCSCCKGVMCSCNDAAGVVFRLWCG